MGIEEESSSAPKAILKTVAETSCLETSGKDQPFKKKRRTKEPGEDLVLQRWYEELARRKGAKYKKKDQLLKLVGERHTGVLVHWANSYGFIKLDYNQGMPTIFVHISDIRRSSWAYVTGRERFEFVVGYDEKEMKAKAILAEILQH